MDASSLRTTLVNNVVVISCITCKIRGLMGMIDVWVVSIRVWWAFFFLLWNGATSCSLGLGRLLLK